jgi:hypothetical protein
VFLDDIVGRRSGDGSTSFEDDAVPQDGWTVERRSCRTAPATKRLKVGGAADAPTTGDIIDAVLRSPVAREPGLQAGNLRPLPVHPAVGASSIDGPLPFRAGEPDKARSTRGLFGDEINGEFVVVHRRTRTNGMGRRSVDAVEGHLGSMRDSQLRREGCGSESQGLRPGPGELRLLVQSDPRGRRVNETSFVADPGVEALVEGQSTFSWVRMDAAASCDLAVGDDAFLRSCVTGPRRDREIWVDCAVHPTRRAGVGATARRIVSRQWMFAPEKRCLRLADQSLRKAGSSKPPAGSQTASFAVIPGPPLTATATRRKLCGPPGWFPVCEPGGLGY